MCFSDEGILSAGTFVAPDRHIINLLRPDMGHRNSVTQYKISRHTHPILSKHCMMKGEKKYKNRQAELW